ncbi:MAG: CDP-alcohol phosphatidyltransferase family protein [Gammaproteobacteria bacterium]|nr:CDP-alcohol phosphatidyltransferase family protein [Pseudomonadales bacterium]MCP5348862.1 CDP-alcohol phosphatidyltransferase family protein [Pseudomonadales bacterium]
MNPLPDPEEQAVAPPIRDRYLTIPNLLCLVRLLGSPGLIPIALQGRNELFLWVFLFLAATDWVDGKLAILLDQRSVFGARLDSWADATLYAALALGVIILYGSTLNAELPWIAMAIASYGVSTLAGFWKYKRWPSYHTRAAKTSWLLTGVAVVALFSDWSILPLRIAATAVILTNLEALLITLISPRWRSDVTSIYHAWRELHRTG